MNYLTQWHLFTSIIHFNLKRHENLNTIHLQTDNSVSLF